MPEFDVLGIGQNAVDRVVTVAEMPDVGGKARIMSEVLTCGGQVATAMVACARLGLRVGYAGTVGDDAAAGLQRESLEGAGLSGVRLLERAGCATQSAYIVIEERSGERTVLWRRDACLALKPEEIDGDWVQGAGLLHLDAGDFPAALYAAGLARETGVPVSLDVDTWYPELGELFARTDYLVAAEGLLERWTGEAATEAAVRRVAEEYGCRAVGVTLGGEGAVLWADGRMHRSPAYAVECVDTTGAGDVFHGAFCYSVWEMKSGRGRSNWVEALDFAHAMAALNCRALGARGGIAGREEVLDFMQRTPRRRSKRA